MTNNGGSPDYAKAFAAAMKVQEFKNILGNKTAYTSEMNAVLDEIDEKFVGDQITRGYNRAKNNEVEFKKYLVLLRKAGVKIRPGLTHDTMTPALIAGVSFDKK